MSPVLRGVLAETATTGLIRCWIVRAKLCLGHASAYEDCRFNRYEWPLLKPLVASLLVSVLRDFEAESKVEVREARSFLRNICARLGWA